MGCLQNPVCKELVLPLSTDEGEKYLPNLVCVNVNERAAGSVCVLAISSKGRLSYWSNVIASNVVTCEAQIEFSSHKEECFNIGSVQVLPW